MIDEQEHEKRLEAGSDIVKNACTKNEEPGAFEAAEAFNLIGFVPAENIDIGRDVKAPS